MISRSIAQKRAAVADAYGLDWDGRELFLYDGDALTSDELAACGIDASDGYGYDADGMAAAISVDEIDVETLALMGIQVAS